SGRKHVYTVDNEKFDKSTIPMRKWSDYEKDLMWETQSQSQYAMSDAGSKFGNGAAMAIRSGSAIGNLPKSMTGYMSNMATNSVYNDNGYGYNQTGINNMMVGGPIPAGAFDYMPASGRASPMMFQQQLQQPMAGTVAPSAYEMLPLGSNTIGSSFGQQQTRMSTVSTSQTGGNPFAQPGMVAVDPRMSAAYSVASAGPANQAAAASQAQGVQQPYLTLSGIDGGLSIYSTDNGAAAANPMMDTQSLQLPLQQQQQWLSGTTDEQIANCVSEIIATADLMTITKKQVREQIMARFGIQDDEARSRRDFINQCVNQELQRRG
ncbi:hypothetical protein GGI12_005087, partial [Dipsacomyces acuminosporus]